MVLRGIYASRTINNLSTKRAKEAPRILLAKLQEFFASFDRTRPPVENADALTDKLVEVILKHTAEANPLMVNASQEYLL